MGTRLYLLPSTVKLLSLLICIHEDRFAIALRSENIFIDDYHYPMVADDVRNELFYAALRKVIIPNVSKVLDVGAGTMLLSMMSMELGAAKVVGVESNVQMCQIAREVLRINNYTNDTSKGNVRLFEGEFKNLRLGHKHVRKSVSFV